jgi:hypothetical protein
MRTLSQEPLKLQQRLNVYLAMGHEPEVAQYLAATYHPSAMLYKFANGQFMSQTEIKTLLGVSKVMFDKLVSECPTVEDLCWRCGMDPEVVIERWKYRYSFKN